MMNIGRSKAAFLAAMIIASALLSACPASNSNATEAADEGSTDVEWFREAKFGMFIHWGLYSHSGGVWDDRRYYGITEWLMKRAKIPAEEYKTLANEFNPVDFDAAQWVAVAKSAGVRYIVITSKHHDGFAMFESKASDFNIVDSTPYGKDPLKVLVDEARKAGIRIGFYYSQYQDWTEKNAAGNDWDFKSDEADFDSYLQEKAVPQLEELLTNYGPIDLIWFDTPGDFSKEDAEELKAWVKRLQPNCLVSDRIGHDLGDIKGYADGEIPAIAESGRPWEAIFTHNDSWGYSKFDKNFKSTAEVLELLIETASKGGNLMLNIGPDGLGRIPAPSESTFRSVGHWLDVHGESIYGTRASPAGKVPWGFITAGTGKIYLHVFELPENGRLIVPGFRGTLGAATLLATGDALSTELAGTDLHVTLPDELPDRHVNVVTVTYSGADAFEDNAATMVSAAFGASRLGVEDLDGGTATVKKHSTMHYFGDWQHYFTVAGLKSPEDSAVWNLRVLDPGTYKIRLNYAASRAEAGQQGLLSVNGEDFYFRVLETGEFNDPGGFAPRKPLMFIDHPVAVVNFDSAGEYPLLLRPIASTGELFKLRSIEVVPHD